MAHSGEAPRSDIFRSPKTPEEEWKESIRIAASVIDANAPNNRHRSRPSERMGIEASPTFEENQWLDDETGDNFILRRFWSRPSHGTLAWRPTYYLRIYYEDGGFDIANPDMVYVFRPHRSMEDKRSLQMLDDEGTYISLEKWCEEADEDPLEHYKMLYTYLGTATKAAGTQLAPRRSLDTKEWVDDDYEFAKIVLGEAVVASQIRIDRTNTMAVPDLLEQSRMIADAVMSGDLGAHTAMNRRQFWQAWRRKNQPVKPLDVYENPDAQPGNWRLSRQALMSAIADRLAMNDSDGTAFAEDSDASK